MNVHISIDGVLRNFINKFHGQYETAYIDTEPIDGDDFEYGVLEPIYNKNLKNHFLFETDDQYNFFRYIEYPMEIYGHATISYNNVVNELHQLIYDNPNIKFTLVGLDEFAKAKSSTLFFLSKNGIMVENIKFIKTEDLKNEWKNCDLWVSDSEIILKNKPYWKDFIKFETGYNQFFTTKKTINKLNELKLNDTNLWKKLLSRLR